VLTTAALAAAMSSARPTTYGPMTEKRAKKFAAAQARAAQAALAAAAAQPPARKRANRQRASRQDPGSSQAISSNEQVGLRTGSARPSGVGSALGTTKTQLLDAFTRQDQAILSYLEGVCDPWTEHQIRVPLIVGGYALDTETFQVVYEGEAFAGTLGFAMVQVGASSWLETQQDNQSGLPAVQYESYNGGTQGSPILSSVNSTTGVSGFSFQGTGAVATVAVTPARLVDATWTSNTRMRIVSVGLEVFSDASLNNATGKVMICSTILPGATTTAYGPSAGGIDGNTFQQIVTTPRKVLERAEVPLAGWKSGDVLRAFAVPSEPQCFSLCSMPGIGSNLTQGAVLGAIGSAMATGQSFSWRVVYNYEAIAEVTNRTSVSTSTSVNAGPDRVANSLPHLMPFRAMAGSPGEISGAPVAVHALANEMSSHRPSHAAAVVEMAKRPALLKMHPQAETLSQGVNKALDKVLDNGWLKKVPLIGGMAHDLVDWGKSIWNMF